MESTKFDELKNKFDEIVLTDTMSQLLACSSKSVPCIPKNRLSDCVSEFMDFINKLSEETYWKSVGRPKDEYKISMHKASRILDMLPHHIYSIHNIIDLRLARKNSDVEDVVKILAHDIQECVRFVKAVFNGEQPDTISLHDTIGFCDFIAVVSDDHYSGIAIRRLLIMSDVAVKDETKRVQKIVKSGGAFYYDEMLSELKSGSFGKRYYVKHLN